MISNVHLLIIALSMGTCFILFAKLRMLSDGAEVDSVITPMKISVIIPVRNEAHNLSGILSDLQKQTLLPLECICVDDGSTDNSHRVIEQYHADYIRIDKKPAGWLGKTYACDVGAKAAKGEFLLFLDADVRLAADAIWQLNGCYQVKPAVISVQPYHQTERLYEQLSFLFNCIVMAMANCFSFINKAPGLFGPVIMIRKNQYLECGGYGHAKGDVLDDIGLGEAVAGAGIPYQRWNGKGYFSFRMYPGGLKELKQGWVKNFAEGSTRVSLPLLGLVILWVTGLLRSTIELCKSIAFGPTPSVYLYLLVYLCMVLQLVWVSRKIGRFNLLLLIYPVLLVGFFYLFTVSVIKKVLHLPVYWKGRAIRRE